MNRYVRFAAVNTKIRALESRFLEDEDFTNLLGKKNITELASYLKNETHYRGVLSDINENEIHRGELENLIRKDHAREIEEIRHYLHGGYRKFFRYIFIKREIEELKKILRAVKNGNINTLNNLNYVGLGSFSNINAEQLISSRDIKEFIGSLTGTIYYRYLQPLEDGGGEKDIFMGEMALDLAYFDLFYKSLDGLEKEDRIIVDRVQGVNVDLLNIQWIYRGIKYYNLPREILFNYTIPHGLHLSLKDVKHLCYCRDLEEFQEKVLNTNYSFLFDNSDTREMFMERRILRYQYYSTNKLKDKHEANISEALAFAILLEYEIRDLVTVIESIRYDMPLNEAKKFLIRKL